MLSFAKKSLEAKISYMGKKQAVQLQVLISLKLLACESFQNLPRPKLLLN